MPEYDEETQAKITGTFFLLIIDALCSWGVVLTIILIFATAADQARKEFNDAESATRDTEKEIRSVYAPISTYKFSKLISIHSLKNELREFDKRSRHFLFTWSFYWFS